MNKTLFVENMKSNWGIFVFIAGMLLVYVATSVMMFDPKGAESFQSMLKMLPEGMIKAFGFNGLGTDLTSYLGAYLYGFIFLIFPLIYTVIVSNRLVAKHVEDGSMAYLLTTPNSRVQIIVTQALFLMASLFVLISFVVFVLIAMAEAMFPGNLDIANFLMLNLVTFLVLSVVAGISFLFSCIFNDTKNAIAFGAGVPILFFVLKMVSEISDKVGFLRYFTIYSLVAPDKITDNGSYTAILCILLLGGVVILYGSAVYVFHKRSLSI